ncbi:MAG: TonB-dependent receptor [Rhodospirillaceae bacterium]|nr:MAG: TonB-dependent receptor [Rhodospirillaceae bacterium]
MKFAMRSFSRYLALSACAVALLTSHGSYGQTEQLVVFNITATDLPGALNQLAQQSDRQIVFGSDVPTKSGTMPLHGTYRVQDALDMLLRGSGVTYKVGQDNTIVVSTADTSAGSKQSSPDGVRAAHPTQTAAAELAAASREGTEPGLEQIIVSAQKREEPLERVPMSITVLNPETIAKSGIVNLMDIGRIATGAQMNFAGGIPGIAVRGISTLISGYNVESNVAIYIDGFYDPNPITMASDMANLDNVEVLKGPQGTLYGRNATGGAFLINTLGPSKTFTGNFDSSYGRFNDTVVNGYVAGPISDRIRFSVSSHYRHDDGWIKKIDPTTIGSYVGGAAPIKEASVRAKLEADVTDDLTATLSLNYGYTKDTPPGLLSVFAHVSPAEPAPPSRPTVFGTAAYNYKNYAFGMEDEATLKLVYNTSIGTLTSHSGYAHHINDSYFDFDGSYADLIYNHFKYDEDTIQQSLDYAITAIDKLDLVAGGLYYHDLFKTAPGVGSIQYGPKLALVSTSQFRQPTEAWALYLDGTYHLTDRLSLTAGGRFSHDYKSAAFQTVSAKGVVTFGPAPNSHAWTKFTPRATARYELAPQTDVYVSWTQGFRSGAYNASPPAGLPLTPVNPETITAYEVGFKTTRSIVRFQTAAFYYDYKDLQVSVTVPNPTCLPGTTCGIVTILQNAPGAHIYGWENEITVTPVERMTLRAGLALLHARYLSFTNATGTGVNATNTLNVSNQVQNWTGKQLARAPDVSGNAGVDYEVPMSYGSLLLTANVNFTSGYAISNPSLYGPLAPAGLQGAQRFRQESYALLSAQVTWTDPSNHYAVTIYGNNLTNKNYRLTYNGGAFGDYSVKAEPITYGAKVGVKF